MLNDLIKTYKNRDIFITENNEAYNFENVSEFTTEISKILPERSLVFALCNNNVESMLGYISFITKKIVPLLLDSKINVDLLNNLITTYEPTYLWIPKDRISNFTDFKVIFSYKEYCLIQLRYKNKHNLNNKLAILLTTSGSTGSPKLVRISYENLISNAKSIAEYLSIDLNQRPITSLPMNYSFGLSVLNSHLIKGSTILLTPRSLMEKGFWEFLKGKKATSISGVPYTFEILKKLKFFDMDLPNLQTLAQAGGKLKKELIIEFARYCKNNNKELYVMYGQTEATARMSYLPPKYLLEKPGSIGIEIPNGSFHLVGDNNTPITEEGKVGELVYEGPNVSMGYATRIKDLSLEGNKKNLLYTGDLAKKDKDGFYFIVGRKSRFIKIFGNRVNLDEVENLLKSMTDDVACTGVDDNINIYITNKLDSSKIKNYLKQKIGINQLAMKIIHLSSIPKNNSGKVMYSEL
jgi:acyl-CoA synthetase (AMP-forming)/AMP-acid ligase II